MKIEGLNVNQYLVNQLTNIPGTNKSTSLDTSYINASMSEVSISSFGKQINTFYSALNSIADPAAKQQARDGLNSVMQSFIADPDSLRTNNFMQTMTELQGQDSDLFQSFFQTANTVNNIGYNLSTWVDTFTNLEGHSAQHAYINESNIILNSTQDAALKQTVFNEFVTTTQTVMDTANDPDKYFSSLADQQSLEDKSKFMANYRDENTSH